MYKYLKNNGLFLIREKHILVRILTDHSFFFYDIYCPKTVLLITVTSMIKKIRILVTINFINHHSTAILLSAS